MTWITRTKRYWIGLICGLTIDALNGKHRFFIRGSSLLSVGTDEIGADAVKKLHFPGLHADAARWLVQNRSIKAIGIDTASIDFGQSTLFQSHVTLFERNVPVFENVANLDRWNSSFLVVALPMKIGGGSGAPLRIIAIERTSSD